MLLTARPALPPLFQTALSALLASLPTLLPTSVSPPVQLASMEISPLALVYHAILLALLVLSQATPTVSLVHPSTMLKTRLSLH